MFGARKIHRMEDNIKVLHKEIRSLQKQFLNLANNYNEYANRTGILPCTLAEPPTVPLAEEASIIEFTVATSPN